MTLPNTAGQVRIRREWKKKSEIDVKLFLIPDSGYKELCDLQQLSMSFSILVHYVNELGYNFLPTLTFYDSTIGYV